MTPLEIRYGGMVMQGKTANAPGLNIVDFDGWDESPDSSFEETSIPGEDGSFDVEVNLTARLASVHGYCNAKSRDDLNWWRGLVKGQTGRPAARRIDVEEDQSVTWALAHCVRVKFPKFGGQAFADFTMDFWLPNPRIYGDTRVFLEGKAAANYGNRGASPVFTIDGDRPGGYTIGGPNGRQIVVIEPVVAGHPHVYDSFTGELTVDGVFVDKKVPVADTWVIPAGTSFVHTITGGSGPFQTGLTDTSI